jgi:hypothetical protein
MHRGAFAIGKIIGCIFGIKIKGFAFWKPAVWTPMGYIFCKAGTPGCLKWGPEYENQKKKFAFIPFARTGSSSYAIGRGGFAGCRGLDFPFKPRRIKGFPESIAPYDPLRNPIGGSAILACLLLSPKEWTFTPLERVC